MSVRDMAVLDGRYELRAMIGRGGMADVYRATDRVLDRSVAVKLLREITGEESDKARFHAEARTLARFSHASLVTVLDAGVHVNQPYLVLELVHGRSLADALADDQVGPQPADRVANIGAQVAGALAYVHAAGIVHRDVKPGNVLLGEADRVWLTDFGIARLIGDATRHTRTGFTIGTAAYLSPEQVRGDDVTPAADVYSLGLVLLEGLTGARAYQGPPMEAALARLHAPPRMPASLSPSWQRALTEMTALDPAARPSAQQVATLLNRLAAAADGGDAADADQTQVLPAPAPGIPAASGDVATRVFRHEPPHRARDRARIGSARARRAFATGSAAAARARPHGLAIVLPAAVIVAVLLAVWIPNLAERGTEPSRRTTVPDGVPTRLHEPLQDLHDAVHKESQ